MKKIDYEKIKEARNISEGFIQALGIEITDLADGYARGEMELTAMHGNPIGSTHGGVLFSVADTIGGAAALTAGSFCTTISGTINYLNAAMGCKKLIGEARAVKVGQRVGVYQVQIFDETEKLICTTTMTYHFFREKMEFPFFVDEEPNA